MKRNCFISYHHKDSEEVRRFVRRFDHLISARGIGEGVNDRDLFINSPDRDYVMGEIRRKYLGASSVTIVMLGRCTWARQYIDWEIASSLRNTVNSKRSALLGIVLPSVARSTVVRPERFFENLLSNYAKQYHYPSDGPALTAMLDTVLDIRERCPERAKNSSKLQRGNKPC